MFFFNLFFFFCELLRFTFEIMFLESILGELAKAEGSINHIFPQCLLYIYAFHSNFVKAKDGF